MSAGQSQDSLAVVLDLAHANAGTSMRAARYLCAGGAPADVSEMTRVAVDLLEGAVELLRIARSAAAEAARPPGTSSPTHSPPKANTH